MARLSFHRFSIRRLSVDGASLDGVDGASLDGVDGTSLDGASLDKAPFDGASFDTTIQHVDDA